MTQKSSLKPPLILVALMVAGSLMAISQARAEDVCIQEKEAVIEVLASHLNAVKAGDMDGLMAVFSPTARMIGAGLTMSGDDIRQSFETALAEADLMPENFADRVEVHEDWALIEGEYREMIRPKSGSSSSLNQGRYLLLLACDGEGAWKFHRVMWWQDLI